MNGTTFALVSRQDIEDEKKRWEMLVMLGRERARIEEQLRQLRWQMDRAKSSRDAAER